MACGGSVLSSSPAAQCGLSKFPIHFPRIRTCLAFVLLIQNIKMAMKRAPLSSLTNLQLENLPFPSFNKPLQRDKFDPDRRHSARTRMMGGGKCNVSVEFQGEKISCPCLQGLFKYNGTSNSLDDTCQDCHHTVLQHESVSGLKEGKSVSFPQLHNIESLLTSQIIQTILTLKSKMPTGPQKLGCVKVSVLAVSRTSLANHQ